MKDPTIADPRLVSEYSVYNGLASFKSYQDTSGEQSSSKKRSKKKAKRNRKKETDNNEAEVKTATVAACNLSKLASSNTGKGASSSKSSKDGQTSSTGHDDDHSVAGSSEKRKKRKKKNKKKANGNQGALDLSVNNTKALGGSDDEDEPPMKSRKTSNLVPNPLAAVKKMRNGEGYKDANAKSSNSTYTIEKKSSKKSVENKSAISLPLTTKRPTTSGSDKPSSSTKKSKKNVLEEATPDTKRKTNLNLTTKTAISKSCPYTVISNVPPVDIKSVFTSSRIEDSVSHGKKVLEWLLHPVSSEEFMKNYWEKKPLHLKRKHSEAADYYKWILTTQMFDDILRRNTVKYGINLDVTSYKDGKRETESESMSGGRVRPAVIWDYYSNGCSIRMLNPQSYIQQLWRLNSSLQEFFGSFVGANLYLTPPDSQGFAPHYDDIEAFILQIEGKKRWKLYAARNNDEVLPRFSSRNFSEENDNLGEPILDIVLEQGDLLYFPRGVIHQAQTVDGEHSLHITLSCNQLNTYGDLLKHHLNHAIDKLMAEDVNFRKGLPTDYLSFLGIAHKNTTDAELQRKRNSFSKKIEELVTKLAKEPVDFAADAMSKKFIWDSLPPYLNSKERETTVVEDGEFMQNGKVFNRCEIGPETEVKLVRKNCMRLVVEEEKIRLYYSTENPLVYHEEEPQHLEVSVELAPAVNHLILQYPKYTKIEDLPISSNDTTQTLQLVSDLWEHGLLFTRDPLEPCDYDDFESADSEEDGEVNQEACTPTNDQENEEVESINLSDLPEEGNDSEDDFNDDFYDTSMAFDSDESNEEDEEGSQLVFNDSDENSEEDASDVEGLLYGNHNENEDAEFDEEDDEEYNEEEDEEDSDDYVEEEDEEDDDEEEEEEEEEEDEDDDGFDFDELDRMEDSDE